MKLLSWNVNGIREVLGKGFGDFVAGENPDILCLQETKAREEQVPLPPELAGYHGFWNSAEKPGYSGVAVFSREAPLSVAHGLDIPEHDREGRVLTLERSEPFGAGGARRRNDAVDNRRRRLGECRRPARLDDGAGAGIHPRRSCIGALRRRCSHAWRGRIDALRRRLTARRRKERSVKPPRWLGRRSVALDGSLGAFCDLDDRLRAVATRQQHIPHAKQKVGLDLKPAATDQVRHRYLRGPA
jgi:hypothetical protein